MRTVMLFFAALAFGVSMFAAGLVHTEAQLVIVLMSFFAGVTFVGFAFVLEELRRR